MRVEVAVLMSGFGMTVPPEVEARSDWSLKWDDRARSVVDVKSRDTVADALNAAAVHFGIRDELTERPQVAHLLGGVSFFRSNTDEGKSKGWHYYAIVDETGRIRWDKNILDVSFAELDSTEQAGVFDGDYRRIYLVPQVPAGAPGDVDWGVILTGFSLTLNALALLDGSLGGLARLRGGVSDIANLLTKHAKTWQRRGGGYADVLEATDEEQRSTEALARLLGINENESQILFKLVGRKMVGEGKWILDPNRDARFYRSLSLCIISLAGSGLLWQEDGDAEARQAFVEAIGLCLRPEGATKREVDECFRRRVNFDE